MRKSFPEIVSADIQRIVIHIDFQHFQIFDVSRKKLAERTLFDRFVGGADDEDIRQAMKGARLAVSQDDPRGFKKSPPVHMARDEKAKRNPPKDKALQVQAVKSIVDIFGIAINRDLSQGISWMKPGRSTK